MSWSIAQPASGGRAWKYPAETLDFAVDLSDEADVTDNPVQAWIAVAPSGTGELNVLQISTAGAQCIFWLGGGQPNRPYTLDIRVTMGSGRVFEAAVRFEVRGVLGTEQPPAAPQSGFGTPLVWTNGAITQGTAMNAVGDNIAAAGTTQVTATALAAQTNIVTVVAAGAGVLLPLIYAGEIAVLNRGANALLVYPPSGYVLEGYAADAPMPLAATSGACRFVFAPDTNTIRIVAA